MSQRPHVLIYTKSWCPYCARAKGLLASKHVQYEEIDVEQEPARRDEMIARSGRHTVPQIFIGDTHVGGFDDMVALDRAGGLEPLLRG